MGKPYKLEITKWGLSITFVGRICKYDLEKWFEEIESITKKFPKDFHLLLNLVEADTICYDSAKAFTVIRAFLHGRGLNRSVIVYDSSVKLVELNKAFIKSGGINIDTRYISIHTHANYMKPALNWLINEEEP